MRRTDVVAREVRIRARPETVFEFFTDPEKMTRWKGIGAELDARPGGAYRIQVSPRDVAVGEYVEIDRPRRIVVTWGWEGDEIVPPGTSTVEVTFTGEGDETVVRVEHRDLPEGAGAVHAEGWEHFLPRLATAAAGGDPGADPWAQ
ncbi:MAG TPA: SRPBCC family protein [Actinomycetota bacterium]|nr:SRPBCC family protein [Actinomycetota bacterium]